MDTKQSYQRLADKHIEMCLELLQLEARLKHSPPQERVYWIGVGNEFGRELHWLEEKVGCPNCVSRTSLRPNFDFEECEGFALFCHQCGWNSLIDPEPTDGINSCSELARSNWNRRKLRERLQPHRELLVRDPNW